MALIERDYASRRLLDAVEQARGGTGLTALVSGEAGIGKTSLVRQLAEHPAGIRVLSGGCEALFSPRPLGPVYDMAADFGGDIHGMLGVEGRRAELFAALYANLRDAPSPTLLVFEDLHWADAATLDLVKYLARRIRALRVLMVLTYRDDEVGERHPLRLVFGDLPADAVLRVPLAPLSEEGVARMAERAGCPDAGVYRATGGNPFFVTEVLCAQEGLPATVRDAVLARAARQPPAVRALLDLVSIVPARIEATTVDAVIGPTADDITAALASGLLVAERGCYAYRHELARMALENALAPPLATALHARVLACLEAGDGDVALARMVHHASGAGDAAAVSMYAPLAAAEAISHGAHSEAARLYAVALAHGTRLSQRPRAALLEQRAYQCYLIDQIDNALAASLEALNLWRELGDRRQEGHMLRWLSRLHWFAGGNREAEACADQAINLLEPLGDDHELAWALSNRSQLDMLAGRTGEAIAWGTRALAMADRLGDVDVTLHALNNVGTARVASGDATGRALIEESLCVALERDLGEHVARAYANLVSTTIAERGYVSGQRTIDEALRYFADRDLDAWRNYVLAFQARVDMDQGRWDTSARSVADLLSCPSVAAVTRIPALSTLARIRMRRGDPGARVLLDEAATLAWATGELQRLAPVAVARAEAAWLDGDGSLDDAFVTHTRELAALRNDRRVLGELGFWCWKLGDDRGAPVDDDDPHVMQWSGDWRSAARCWEQLGCGYMQAVALMDGDDDARRDALARLTAMGAEATARLCRAQMRRAGVRGMSRGPRASTSANPAGLTTRERHVMALLAKGLSNAEIAGRIVRSEKTVEHHISAILRKLDVCSRGEAIAVASRLGLTDESA